MSRRCLKLPVFVVSVSDIKGGDYLIQELIAPSIKDFTGKNKAKYNKTVRTAKSFTDTHL